MTGRPTGWAPPAGQARKVLAAALKLFDQVGYSAATIEDIRLQSEVSVGSIYHHFGSKEGIAGALYTQALASFQRGLLRTLAENRAAEPGVRAGVAHHLAWVGADRPRARFLMRRRETEVARTNQADVDLLNRELLVGAEEWYRPLAEAGEIRELSLPLLYAIWFGPAQEYARQVLEWPRRGRLADAEPALADAAWAALRSSR